MYTEQQDDALMWRDNNEVFQTEDISGVEVKDKRCQATEPNGIILLNFES